MKTLAYAAHWYVYKLSDPRDGVVFYVGKGSGNRDERHEKDALNPKAVCSKKIKKIRDIQACNLPIAKERVAFFWDEQAAYDHETDLIEEIGLENLTNVLPGGQKAWERRQQERASRREKPDEPWHKLLAKKAHEALMERLAEWLRAGGHEGRRWTFTASDPAFKWHAAISDAVYNKFFPSMWEDVKGDELALAVIRDRIRPYGVELVYGGA